MYWTTNTNTDIDLFINDKGTNTDIFTNKKNIYKSS